MKNKPIIPYNVIFVDKIYKDNCRGNKVYFETSNSYEIFLNLHKDIPDGLDIVLINTEQEKYLYSQGVYSKWN